MRALGEELLEPRLRQRCGVGPRDANHVEAAGSRGFDQGCLDAGRIVQKSRSV
jgi:hypothetical protein